jgi:hypothetical protein
MFNIKKNAPKFPVSKKFFKAAVRPSLVIAMVAALTLPAACSAQTPATTEAPAPTMSQQQIEQRLAAMKYYYNTYGDIYAAVALRDMFEAGQITQEDYTGACGQTGDALRHADIKELHKLRDMLNCLLTRLSQKNLLKCRLILSEAMKECPVLISIFNSQQQRDEVENAVKTIDKWALSPDEQHTKDMETKLGSEAISCGARLYLYYYAAEASGQIQTVSADGEIYDPEYYIEVKIGGYLQNALDELLEQNNDKDVPAETDGF